jgi:hypothetical protein
VGLALANVQSRIDKANALAMDHWAALPQDTLPDAARELVREWLAAWASWSRSSRQRARMWNVSGSL